MIPRAEWVEPRRCARCQRPVEDHLVSAREQLHVDGALQTVTITVMNRPCGCVWRGPADRRVETLTGPCPA